MSLLSTRASLLAVLVSLVLVPAVHAEEARSQDEAGQQAQDRPDEADERRFDDHGPQHLSARGPDSRRGTR